LYVASITQHNVTTPVGPSETIFEQNIVTLLTNGRPWCVAKFGRFCHGKTRNFAN